MGALLVAHGRKVLEALSAALLTFLTGIAFYKSFHDLNGDTLFEPTIQAAIIFFSVLAGRSIPAGADPPPKG